MMSSNINKIRLWCVENCSAFLICVSFPQNLLTADDDYPGCDMCDCPHCHYW